MKQNETAAYEANVRKTFVYGTLMEFTLWLPIWVLYLREERGFTLTQITLLDVPFFLLVVFAELPAGAVADRFGRRVSLVLSSGFFAVAAFVFGISGNFGVIIVANLTFGLAVTFRSGADSALLYDSLKGAGRVDDFQRVTSRLWATKSTAMVLGLILGAPIAAATSFTFTFIVGSLTNLCAMAVALTMHEPKHAAEHVHEPFMRTLRWGVRDAWRRPSVRWIIVYSGIISAGTFGPLIVFQQPWLAEHGISTANVGLWQAPARIAGILAALASGWLLLRLGQRGAFFALPVTLIACNLALAGIDHAWIAVGFLGMGIVSGLQDPLVTTYINDRIGSERRATVLSVQNLVANLTLAIVQPLGGVVADAYGLQAVFLMFAVVVLMFGGGALMLWDRAERTDDHEPAGDLGTRIVPVS